MSKDYFIGLDIGTDSVGYAVTDRSYDLLKIKGERAWGVQLFDAAELCQKRRGFRSGRRRLDRRQFRIQLLQEIFAQEIAKVDKKFFIRLKNSALWRDDAGEPYCIFNDNNYTDKEYHTDYPTIHHLIHELMTSSKEHDVRLVYIALAWLIAHRGHFLNEISKNNISRLKDFDSVYNNLLCWFSERDISIPVPLSNADIIGDVLRQRLSVSRKFDMLKNQLNSGKRFPKDETIPVSTELLLKLLCGSKVSLKELFINDEYADYGSFTLDTEDDAFAELFEKLTDDESELLKRAKAIFDWVVLIDILDGKSSISEAKVAAYNTHKDDLKWLKTFIHTYCPKEYYGIFRDMNADDNYVAYSSSNNAQEKFYKRILKLIKNTPPCEEEKEKYDDAISRIETRKFLPKQVNTDNRVIPYQLYWHELDAVLKNAQKYLHFLSEEDNCGISNADKIRSVFEFRVPYFVGPLNSHSPNAWIVRKESGRILPWNIREKIDFDNSENSFIKNLIGKCTYLAGEDVIPKDSLCYHKFTVLNEINNIQINGEKIPVELKQKIYNELFMKFKKVTRKKLEDFLRSEGCLNDNAKLSGIDIQIKSDLKPQLDFKRLLDSKTLNEADVEAIILRITASDSKKRIKSWLTANYPKLESDDIKYISGLNYKDFGRLSARFLNEIEGINEQTGEVTTILSALWNTNNNLMELLSDKYTFIDKLEEENKRYYSANPRSVSERLDEMYISNAVKRPIIRTLDIVSDIVKIVGSEPEKIFIEMSRGANEEQKNKRTESRLAQILKLYDKCRDEDTAELRKQLEAMGESANTKLQSKSLFLYYMQLGKCMYTGEAIELSELGTKRYDIDHIYPQSLVKDDSLHNNMVLVTSAANGTKQDKYPVVPEIQHKMRSYWKMLLDNGLMTEEKYKRLTRTTPFTTDEKWGFINRQLTETRQSTKAVATLLKELYPDTEIVYVKANLAAEFRQEFELLKSRTYNDLHHAKDAYLNIVVGNVYNSRFTKQWFYSAPEQSYSIKTKTLYTHPVKCGNELVWDGVPMLDKVKKNVKCDHAHMTRYSFCRKSGQNGGFFDQNPVRGTDKNGEVKKGLIPRKNGMPTERYGGYSGATISYFMLVKFRAGKKCDLMITPIRLLDVSYVEKNEDAAAEYVKQRISEIIDKPVDEVSFPLGMRKIKINTIFSLDGFRVCLTGISSLGKKLLLPPYIPFRGTHEINTYIKALERLSEKITNNSNYVYDAENDIVCAEKNIEMYRMYIDKMENTIYKKRPSINNALEVLKKGSDKFEALDIFTQTKTLLNIHQLFGRMSGGCDLDAIGGSRSTAVPDLNSKLSNWTKNYSDVRIIDCSASGLYEHVSEINLLELL